MGDAASEPGVMHVLCSNHGGGQPHWVTRANSTALEWTYVNTISTAPALEPTPVYSGGRPGDEATVNHFIARTEKPECAGKAERKPGCLYIVLYALEWVDNNSSTAPAL